MNNVNINNEQQSTTGNIKNETTTPQVELLFRKRFLDLTTGFYWDRQGLYDPGTGEMIAPLYRGAAEGSGTDCSTDAGCPIGQHCVDGVCKVVSGSSSSDSTGSGGSVGSTACRSIDVTVSMDSEGGVTASTDVNITVGWTSWSGGFWSDVSDFIEDRFESALDTFGMLLIGDIGGALNNERVDYFITPIWLGAHQPRVDASIGQECDI